MAGPSKILRLARMFDRQVVTNKTAKGDERIDSLESARENWHRAKLNFLLASGGGVFTGAAFLDANFSMFGGLAAQVLMTLFGATTGVLLSLGVKNTADAAVWGVIAGVEQGINLAKRRLS